MEVFGGEGVCTLAKFSLLCCVYETCSNILLSLSIVCESVSYFQWQERVGTIALLCAPFKKCVLESSTGDLSLDYYLALVLLVSPFAFSGGLRVSVCCELNSLPKLPLLVSQHEFVLVESRVFGEAPCLSASESLLPCSLWVDKSEGNFQLTKILRVKHFLFY